MCHSQTPNSSPSHPVPTITTVEAKLAELHHCKTALDMERAAATNYEGGGVRG
jgi:hypothetical protein